jgi:hypothetical protein
MVSVGYNSIDTGDYNKEPDKRSPSTYITFIRIITDGTSWFRVSKEEVVRTGFNT